MAGIVQFVETFLRVMIALVFLVSPGICFWVVLSALLLTVGRLTGLHLFGTQSKQAGPVLGSPSLGP